MTDDEFRAAVDHLGLQLTPQGELVVVDFDRDDPQVVERIVTCAVSGLPRGKFTTDTERVAIAVMAMSVAGHDRMGYFSLTESDALINRLRQFPGMPRQWADMAAVAYSSSLALQALGRPLQKMPWDLLVGHQSNRQSSFSDPDERVALRDKLCSIASGVLERFEEIDGWLAGVIDQAPARGIVELGTQGKVYGAALRPFIQSTLFRMGRWDAVLDAHDQAGKRRELLAALRACIDHLSAADLAHDDHLVPSVLVARLLATLPEDP